MNEYTRTFDFNGRTNRIDLFLQTFVNGKLAAGTSKETIKIYKEKLIPWFRWNEAHGIIVLGDLTPAAIRAHLAEYGEHHTQGGVHHIFRSIRCYLNWVWEEYDFEIPNPIKKVKCATGKPAPIQGVDPADVDKLFDAAKAGEQPERDCALLAILLDTGIRKKSLYNIRKCDIDILNGSIYIRHAKNGEAFTVYLGQRAKRYVRKFVKTLDKVRDDEIVWQSREGGVMRFDNIPNILRTLSHRAGCPFYSAHDYRRYFALSSYRAGADVFAVAEMLGHKDITMTKRYLAITETDRKEIHDKYSPLDKC